MGDLIMLSLGLASVAVTVQPHLERNGKGGDVTVTEGVLTSPLPRVCPRCGGVMDVHDHQEVLVQDIPLRLRVHLLRVRKTVCQCRECGHSRSQEVPFQAKGHRMTRMMEQVLMHELNGSRTIKEVSARYAVHPNSVKDIDRRRLERRFAERKPRPCRYLGVDEFLLHRGHQYATVFLDLESGDVLYCTEGKDKETVYRFLQFVGEKWMKGVQAVAMDMNAPYDSAFRERCPHVRIAYDFFHLVKLGNDSMLTRLRRRRQRELLESGDEQSYRLYKGCRFIVLSDRSTLQKRDQAAREHNDEVCRGIRDGSLPGNTPRRRADRERRLDRLLAANEDLYRCYFLMDQLKAAFRSPPRNAHAVRQSFLQWIAFALQSGVPEAIQFASTVENHLDGIVNAVILGLSTGKVEGTNNMIKTTRRMAYGFHDTQYFFWKIMENSRKPYGHWKSPKILH
jgi:transposase